MRWLKINYTVNVVNIYSILICAMMLNCKPQYFQIENEVWHELNSNYHLKNFRRYALDENNHLIYEIFGRDAFFIRSEQENRVRIFDFKYLSYNAQGQLLSTLSGRQGEFDMRDRWIQINYDAKYISKSGLSILSAELRYDIINRIVESNRRVSIKEKTITTICQEGVHINERKQKKICHSPVLSPTGFWDIK